MIAVVTGGSGFIGHNLVRRLLRDGHTVRCLVRPLGGYPPQGAERYVVQYDEPRTLHDCPAFDGAEVVFHVAGATKGVWPEAFVAANVTPTRHLLGALVARRLRPRFVLVSSLAAAGPAPAPDRLLTEEDVPRPVEAYGRSKLEAERIVDSFGDRVPTTVVRPAAVFGPRDHDFLTLFQLATHGVVVYPGVMDHWVSVVFVEDVVAGLLAAAMNAAAISRTYFLTAEPPVLWREFGDQVGAAAGRAVRHVNAPAALIRGASAAAEWIGRLTDTATIANRSKAELARHPYWICSAARARRELGFHEARSLPDAIRETYLWYRQRGLVRGSSGAATAVA